MIYGLMRYVVGNRKSKKVRGVFIKYTQSYLEFLDIAEQRALNLTREKVPDWEIAFGLQRSLKKQQICRFERLFNRSEGIFLIHKTLDAITERLDRGWSEAEEADLLQSSQDYAELKKTIEGYRARANPEALAKHRTVLERDPQYGNARDALAERAKRFSDEMRALLQE